MTRQMLGEEQIRQFDAGHYGHLLRRGDPTYVDAGAVENGVIADHPARIARCVGGKRPFLIERKSKQGDVQ